MVAAARLDADPRLFSRRGRERPALLDLSRRALRARDRAEGRSCGASRLVHAWAARMTLSPGYAESAVTSNFSFLRGAWHPQEYVHQAAAFGFAAIGIADRNTRAGIVRAYAELENPELTSQPKLLVGSRLVFIDGTPDILAYPHDRRAYGRLCRLLSKGKLAAEKGECHLRFADLAEFSEGLLLVLVPAYRFTADDVTSQLNALRGLPAEGIWLAASPFHRGDDKRRLARLQRIAGDVRVPLIATNDVLYHDPGRRVLQDVVSCIREKTTIETAGR